MDMDAYFFEKYLHMHRKFSEDSHNGLRHVNCVMVPESYRSEVLWVEHTSPLAGHMGSTKTFNRIAAYFFWPGLHFHVRKYCATCPKCQLVAQKRKSHKAPVKQSLSGKLPQTATGYRYILTTADYATHYSEAITLKNTSSRVIADALLHYFCRVSSPEELVPDQGSSFVGKLMAQLYEQLASANFITMLDITKGYWQVPLETSTIEKSAFITSKGLYEFLVMPFSMKGLNVTNAYIDDVEVDTSSSRTQHLSQLHQFLNVFDTTV